MSFNDRREGRKRNCKNEQNQTQHLSFRNTARYQNWHLGHEQDPEISATVPSEGNNCHSGLGKYDI